jgi:cytochrome c
MQKAQFLSSRIGLGLLALLLSMPVALAQTAGDAQKGQTVFNQCKVCHSLDAGKNLMGPSLHGLIGRKSGAAAGFNYSAAMKSANITWDADTLSKYLADPKSFIAGTTMIFAGVKDDASRRDLIAYLEQATK